MGLRSGEMAEPRAPIPVELWRRMAVLDRRCDFLLERAHVRKGPHGQGATLYEREWRVSITDRADLDRGPVVCAAPTLAMALEGAVAMAEGCGWSNPKDAARTTNTPRRTSEGSR
jgi:hypothetical protein